MSKKSEIITFKADESLLEALHGIPNRSDFIRTAVLAALENSCPMCGGTGQLSPNQRQHWERFARNHELAECSHCHELHLVCDRERGESKRGKVHS